MYIESEQNIIFKYSDIDYQVKVTFEKNETISYYDYVWPKALFPWIKTAVVTDYNIQ